MGPAWAWRWQAPELALVFGERALRTAEQRGDQLAGLWAQTLVVSASCRLGQQLAVVDKAIEALRLSERLADDDSGAILRVELAGCARSAGVPLVGAGLLRPVLSATDARPSVRAAALIQLAGCLAYSERHRELDSALAEADQLYADDREFDQDTRLGLRAVLRSFVAREHRRRGDLRSALHAAEEGANLLDGLGDPAADGGAAARISLQQVLGLLDLGWVDQAATVAAGALSGPVRAHSAAAVGWLALAICTRVQLPAGLLEPAIALLQEITTMAERHHRDALHAESLSALSEAHELSGELAETLDHLRSAQVIRARRSRMLRAARSALLSEFGEARNADGLLRLLNPTLSTGRRATVERDAPLFGQPSDKTAGPEPSGITLVLIDVAKARTGMPPATRGPAAAGSIGPGAAGIGTWTAESLGAGARSGDPIGESVLRKVVEHLRDLTPAEAAVARVGGAELAVLLPGTSRTQVERWAEELRAAMADVDWGQVTPGLTINVRTVVTEADQALAMPAQPGPAQPGRTTTSSPASGIALDAQPARARRSGELTSPRLPIPPQPAEPERSAVVSDQSVPPARTPAESPFPSPEQPTGRRARGTLPVEAPEPVRTPLPQATWSGLLSPESAADAAETARRRHAASQEPTQRWTPVWLPADEESDTGRWLLGPAAAKPAQSDPARPEPTQANSTQANPTQPGPARLNPTQPDSTQLNPTRPDSIQRDPAQLNPIQPDAIRRDPTQLSLTRPSPAQSKPAEPTLAAPRSAAPTPAEPLAVAPSKPEPQAPAAESSTPHRTTDTPTGLDRFGLGGLISTGRRRSEDADPARTSHRSPEPAALSTPDSGRRRAEETPSAEPVARHSAPPAESNRSVLDSLGISAGSGGRRRAPETTDPARPPGPEPALPAVSTSQPTSSDSEPTGRRARRDYSQPLLAGLIPPAEPSSGGRRRADDTIPKIRLPQLPTPTQPSTPEPAPAGFPGAAFPGSGFAGLNPQAAPDPTPPTGFPAQSLTGSPMTGETPAPFGLPPTGFSASPAPSVPFGAPPFGVPSGSPAGRSTPSHAMPPPMTGPAASATGSADFVSPTDLTPPSGFALPAMGLSATGSPAPGMPATSPGSSGDTAFPAQDSTPATPRSGFAMPPGARATPPTPEIPPAFDISTGENLPRIDLGQRPADDGRTASGYIDLSRISSGNVEFGSGYYFGRPSPETPPGAAPVARTEPAPSTGPAPAMDAVGAPRAEAPRAHVAPMAATARADMAPKIETPRTEAASRMEPSVHRTDTAPRTYTAPRVDVTPQAEAPRADPAPRPDAALGTDAAPTTDAALRTDAAPKVDTAPRGDAAPAVGSPARTAAEPASGEPASVGSAVAESALAESAVAGSALAGPAESGAQARGAEAPGTEAPGTEARGVEARGAGAGDSGAEGGSSFSALSEFSAMLARFDDPSALELSEPSTTPLRPSGDEPAEAPALPEPEPTPRAERSATAQPFAPETVFGTSEKPAVEPAPKQEVGGALRPSPPPPGIAAKLAGPSTAGPSSAGLSSGGPSNAGLSNAGLSDVGLSDVGSSDLAAESDVASIEGRSGRGRRRTPKLGDLLTEALRAYQDVRDADEAQDSLANAAEPSELGATELSSWLGTGTEPLGSIDPPSWRPGSSTRSFGVARHSDGDEAGTDWNPPTS